MTATQTEYQCPTGDVTDEFAAILGTVSLAGKKPPKIRAHVLMQLAAAADAVAAVHGEPPITKQACHVSAGANEPPLSRVVIHTAECACQPGAVVGIGNYFGTQASGGSAQYAVDPTAEGHYVHDAAIAWHAPPNKGSIGVEIAGRAAFTANDWQQPNVQAALHRAAARTADLVRRYGLPVVWLSPNDLLAGKRGITGHVCVSQAWHQSNHTDPGPNFPVKQFLGYVLAYLGQHPTPVPRPRPPVKPKPSVTLTKALQRAAHVTPDGVWGKVTDAALARLRDTHPASPQPTIRLLQKQLGQTVDGDWGTHTDAAVHVAIRNVQAALHVTADGEWGQHTETAFAAARAANYRP